MARYVMNATPPESRRHTFLFAGWAHFEDLPDLRPYWAMITNTRDVAGKPTPTPLDSFSACRQYLRRQEDSHFVVAGESVTPARAENLERNMRRLIAREIGPKEALRLLVDEVINTSKRCPGVVSKVLGFCIPQKAAQRFFEKGQAVMLAAQPNPDTAAFTYFEDGYNDLEQYGPTAVCGNSAVTDVKTENDPSRDFQRSSIRILSLGKPSPRT